MSEKPDFAPGCFGSAMFANDECCRACEFASACEPVHLRILEQLRDFHGFATRKPKRQAGVLPVKVQKIFEELGISAENIRNSILSGLNPFSVRAGFIGLACFAILKRETVSRQTIAALIAEKRNYRIETAEVYARYAVQILEHCGAIEVDGDTVKAVTESTVNRLSKGL